MHGRDCIIKNRSCRLLRNESHLRDHQRAQAPRGTGDPRIRARAGGSRPARDTGHRTCRSRRREGPCRPRSTRAPDLPVLVEDSGLMVDAWDGFPGALTKWLMQSVGNEGLLRMLSEGGDRSARAVCVVALAEADGTVRTFRGEVPGTLASEPRGAGGFGYDPVFVPGWSSMTYAEMGEGKNADSHRARAFRAVREWLGEAQNRV